MGAVTPPAPPVPLDPQVRSEVDRWLTRRGLPHLITGYSAREDVLTRTLPFLAVVFVFEVLLALNLDWPLWGNLAAVGGGGLLLFGSYGLLNRAQGRPMFALPRRVGNGEIATFLLLPALLPVVFGGDLSAAAGAVLGNLIVLGVAYLVTSYGLLPMVRWAMGQTGRHLVAVGHLAARALPMLLLFATFVFVNAELWQISQDFTTATFIATVLLFVGAGLVFFLLRLPRQTADIARFASWEEVDAATVGTPVGDLAAPTSMPLDQVPALGRADRLNVGLLLVVTQGVQILLVAALIGLFFTAFGLIAIRETTILSWTSEEVTVLARLTLWDTPVVLSAELLRVATFIAAFSGLQFTVSASTDETWRPEFVDDVVGEVREAMAVLTGIKAVRVEVIAVPRFASGASRTRPKTAHGALLRRWSSGPAAETARPARRRSRRRAHPRRGSRQLHVRCARPR
ncbi:hypothetical protein BH23ACT9_BH23ACT9_21720 [soil metagenome]